MTFSEIVLKWYATNAREFPWRSKITSTAEQIYRTWVCEIMSQQTVISVVVPKFEQFVHTCPDVNALAHCSETTLHKLWQGLGYYARARNLKKGALFIVENYGDDIHIPYPKNYQQWLDVPGCGPYTAAMICSVCFQEAVPSIDGNVIRLVSRLLGLKSGVWNSQGQKKITSYVQERMSTKNPGDFNQAMMDLGSTVCKKQNPECSICPLSSQCVSLQKNIVADCPPVKERAAKESLFVFVLVFKKKQTQATLSSGEFLLFKRTKGLLSKTVGFPLYVSKEKKSINDIIKKCEAAGCDVSLAERSFRHSITKYGIEGQALLIDMKRSSERHREALLEDLGCEGSFSWESYEQLGDKISASLDQKALKTLSLKGR